MNETRQHYNLAVEGKATQKCNQDHGPRDSKDSGGDRSDAPHRDEKESHRE